MGNTVSDALGSTSDASPKAPKASKAFKASKGAKASRASRASKASKGATTSKASKGANGPKVQKASKASNAKTSKVQSTHKDMNANSELVIVPSRGVESTSNSKSYQSSQSIEVHVGPDGRGVARSVIEENGRRKERMFERLPSGEWHATQG